MMNSEPVTCYLTFNAWSAALGSVVLLAGRARMCQASELQAETLYIHSMYVPNLA